jgi:hypothetical protein
MRRYDSNLENALRVTTPRNSLGAKFIGLDCGRAGRVEPWKRRKPPMKISVKTIGAALVAASVFLANPAEARWRGWGWGGLGLGLAAGAIFGGAIAASAYPYYGYGYRSAYYGYGYPAYYSYGYGYPAYRVAYAYPSRGYGYYPRRAYYGYGYAPRVAYGGYYPRRAYRAYAFAPGWRGYHRRWR